MQAIANLYVATVQVDANLNFQLYCLECFRKYGSKDSARVEFSSASFKEHFKQEHLVDNRISDEPPAKQTKSEDVVILDSDCEDDVDFLTVTKMARNNEKTTARSMSADSANAKADQPLNIIHITQNASNDGSAKKTADYITPDRLTICIPNRLQVTHNFSQHNGTSTCNPEIRVRELHVDGKTQSRENSPFQIGPEMPSRLEKLLSNKTRMSPHITRIPKMPPLLKLNEQCTSMRASSLSSAEVDASSNQNREYAANAVVRPKARDLVIAEVQPNINRGSHTNCEMCPNSSSGINNIPQPTAKAFNTIDLNTNASQGTASNTSMQSPPKTAASHPNANLNLNQTFNSTEEPLTNGNLRNNFSLNSIVLSAPTNNYDQQSPWNFATKNHSQTQQATEMNTDDDGSTQLSASRNHSSWSSSAVLNANGGSSFESDVPTTVDLKTKHKPAQENTVEKTAATGDHDNVTAKFCAYCMELFSNVLDAPYHMCKQVELMAGFTTRPLAKFRCNLCTAGTRTKESMKNHQLRNHSHNMHPNKVKCDVCNKLLLKTNLSRHKLLHSNFCFYKCNICQLLFKDKKSLKSHLQIVHEAPFRGNAPVQVPELSSEDRVFLLDFFNNMKRQWLQESNLDAVPNFSQKWSHFPTLPSQLSTTMVSPQSSADSTHSEGGN